MNSSNYQVNLQFNANTASAKQQLLELQSTLNSISAAGKVGIGTEQITQEMQKASQAAQELQMHLTKAMDVNTGKLDLNKLNNSLLSSKTSLTQLATNLRSIGPTGNQAFTQLATAISKANMPALTLSSTFSNLWLTMKNTMKWQLSSSVLHGLIGSIQGAYGYAKDLNESLNNIRIVTGQSADQMAKFAVEANKAAKALSTTTTEYTNASLIYFQQGLNTEEVKKRADVTIKLANVSRQSAETVSDQMTAVWNNFYDGSKSLEYYADVLTALGAATASSTDEIAGGLEKFAAIGNTIGLSYEYAAAALATITANTRQSEDVVGTALKTIFARIQGLKLGETLEDGTSLNKYSQALQTVGISIFEQNGELKAMDNILDEMGAKWETLNDAQKTALAQTVAGIRQYNQLISLMDNWNKGDSDSFQSNLVTIEGAEGTLQDQADIYAESWEAASDRVKASAEGIYQSILKDEFFINLNNGFSSILDSLKAFIDGIGGMKGILGVAIAFITSALASKLQPAIANTIANFQTMFTTASARATKLRTEMQGLVDQAKADTGFNNLTRSQEVELQNANELIIAKTQLSKVSKNLTSHEKMLADINLGLIESEQQKAVAIASTIDKLNEEKIAMEKAMVSSSTTSSMETVMMSPLDKKSDKLENIRDSARLTGDTELQAQAEAQLSNLNKNYENINYAATKAAEAISTKFVESLKTGNQQTASGKEIFSEYINQLEKLGNTGNISKNGVEGTKESIQNYVATLPKAITQSADFQKALDKIQNSKTGKSLNTGIKELVNSLKNAKLPAEQLEKILRQLGQGKNIDEYKKNIQQLTNEEEKLTKTQQKLNQAVQNFNPTHKFTGIEKVTAMSSALMSVSMAWNSIKSAVSAWKDPDMSNTEKIMTTFMSFGMIVPMITGGLNNLAKAFGLANLAEGKFTFQTAASLFSLNSYVTGLKAEEAQNYRNIIAKKLSEGATQDEILTNLLAGKTEEEQVRIKAFANKQIMAQTALTKLQTAADNGNVIAKAALNLLQKVGIVTTTSETVAKGADTAATTGLTVANIGLQASMLPVLLITLAVIAAIAALVAVVALVVIGIQAWIKEAKKEEEAAKIATENLNAMKEAQERLNNEMKEFQELTSAYDEAAEKLETLDKGTKEYADTLKSANEKARELIDTYGLIRDEDWYYEDGLIKFREGVLEGIENNKQQQIDAAKQNVAMGNIIQIQANQDKENKELRKELGALKVSSSQVSHQGVAYRSKNASRAFNENETEQIAKFLSENKSLTSEALKAQLAEEFKNWNINFSGTYANEDLNDTINNIIKVREEFEEFGDTVLDNEKKINEFGNQLIEADVAAHMGKAYEGMATNAEGQINYALANNLTQLAANYEIALSEQNDQTVGEKLSEFEDDIDDISTNAALKKFLLDDDLGLTKEEKEEYQDYTDEVRAGNKDGEDEALARLYAKEVLGLDNVDKLQYVGSKGKGKFMSADGKEEIMPELEDEVMIRAIAQAAARKKIMKDYGSDVEQDRKDMEQTLKDLMDGANKLSDEFGGDFATVLTNAFLSGDTEKIDLTALFSELSPEEVAKLSTMTPEELAATLGLDPEEFAKVGNTTAEDFSKAFEKGLDEYSASAYYQNLYKDLKENLSELIDIVDTLELGSVLEQENYDLLVSYNKELEKYFRLTKDGKYEFLGGVSQEELLEATLTGLEEQLGALEYMAGTADLYNKNSGSVSDVNTKTFAVGFGDYKNGQISREELEKQYGDGNLGHAILADDLKSFLIEGQGWSEAKWEDFKNSNGNDSLLQEALDAWDSAISAGTEINNIQAQIADLLISDYATLQKFRGTEHLSEENYVGNLLSFANKYDNTKDEVNAYWAAEKSGDKGALESAITNLEIAAQIGEAAEMYGLSADALEVYAKQLAETEELEIQAATDLAIANMTVKNSVSDMKDEFEGLYENYDNYSDWAEDTSPLEYAETIAKLNEKLATMQLLGIVPEGLTDEQKWEFVQTLISGTAEEIDNLLIKMRLLTSAGKTADTEVKTVASAKTNQFLYADSSGTSYYSTKNGETSQSTIDPEIEKIVADKKITEEEFETLSNFNFWDEETLSNIDKLRTRNGEWSLNENQDLIFTPSESSAIVNADGVVTGYDNEVDKFLAEQYSATGINKQAYTVKTKDEEGNKIEQLDVQKILTEAKTKAIEYGLEGKDLEEALVKILNAYLGEGTLISVSDNATPEQPKGAAARGNGPLLSGGNEPVSLILDQTVSDYVAGFVSGNFDNTSAYVTTKTSSTANAATEDDTDWTNPNTGKEKYYDKDLTEYEERRLANIEERKAKLEKEAENLNVFSKEYSENLENQKKILEEERDILKAAQADSQTEVDKYRARLVNLGVKFEVDENGELIPTNLEELRASYHNAIQTAGSEATLEENEENLDLLNETIDLFDSAIEKNKKYTEQLEEAEKSLNVNKKVLTVFEKEQILLEAQEDIYRDINKQLDVSEKKLSNISKLKEKAYGKDYLKRLDEENEMLKNNIGLLEDQKEIAQSDAELYTRHLMAYLDNPDLAKDFDLGVVTQRWVKDAEYGYYYLANAGQILQAMEAQILELKASDASEFIIQDLEKKYEFISSLFDSLDDSIDQIVSSSDSIQDNSDQILENNYERIMKKYELQQELYETDMKLLEYYFEKASENFAERAEALSHLNDQIQKTTGSFDQLNTQFIELEQAQQAGTITPEKYIEGLKQTQESIWSTIEALEEYDKAMVEYYGETLNKGQEELEKYTNQIEHYGSVIEHYKNVVELMGKGFNDSYYKNVNTLLKANTKNAKASLDVAVGNYEVLKEQYALQKKQYEEALANGTTELELEGLKKDLDAITEKFSEAEENALEKVEAWGEALKEEFKGVLEEASNIFEMTVTKNWGFEAVSDSLSRLSTNADEYLTKTNQIYEVEKMLNTIAQEIDKTDNEAAKNRLNNFAKEISNLKNQTQLSNLELKIAQARYDVLKAEIALEEAQNAKSTVRLTRDNEGNFGYVYTADQNAIANAEQELSNKQNALYNIGLDAANSYGEKRIQIQKEYFEKLQELEEKAMEEGYYGTERYNEEKARITEEYNNIMITYSNLYTTALGVDANIQTDAWITSREDMMLSTEEWNQHTEEFLEATGEAFEEYSNKVNAEGNILKGLLENLTDNTNEVNKATDELVEAITDPENGVLKALQDEYNEVDLVAGAYYRERDAIFAARDAMLELIKTIRDKIALEGELEALSSSKTSTDMNYQAEMEKWLSDPEHSIEDSYYKWLEAMRNEKVKQDEFKEYGGENAVLNAQNNEAYSKLIQKKARGEKLTPTEQAFVEAIAAGNLTAADVVELNKQIPSLTFDTGGYTGIWGPEGRWAMLHQKELVLNENDTANFLQATGVLRSIAQMIDLNALNNWVNALPYFSSNLFNTNNDKLEQEVHIEAHFPNVTEHSEIEEAFNNLINTASQYANRKTIQ